MALELYVWGPALGLDSIDPECLAAVACLRRLVPRGDWSLIASNDATAGPGCRLPALSHSGVWTSGYANILSYLARHGIFHIDDGLTTLQKADSLAYASFLATRGAGLVAMSLYVSPRAWAEITRPAYSSLLPFPLTWTIPSAVRAAAVQTAEHLGIGHLAAEVDAEEPLPSSGIAETTTTGFLRLRHRLGPSRTMQPEHAASIRFQHFAEDFYHVMDQLRGDKKFFLQDDKPSSLDFLAYGYLQLMRVRTPHPILKTALEKSYSRLAGFLSEMEAFEHGQDLPWREPAPRGALGLISSFAAGSLEAVPGVDNGWRKWRDGGVQEGCGGDGASHPTQVVVAIGGAVASVVALCVVALFRALSPFGASTHRFEQIKENDANDTGLKKFGEVGMLLDGLPVWELPEVAPPPSSSPR
ncbi:Tom37 C-terminal domain-containing protein [Durotheca rogersii]|uniref:Tom37 C-terminal domain-containing protein n=1 Tax=Durotheca rogersii TaxID=419775 RepID=UPI00221EA0A6|nr:Tom37 C-terminal domain-containing protein [Durotheca rogersii]KAI5859572.1 Tom37 C-terminal domain-containing protein [Durotheca rogersii]